MESVTTKSTTVTSIVNTISDYYELTKPGITISVVSSMIIGFLLGSAVHIDYLLLAHAILGTWFIASGTAAHNMFMERSLDGLMQRTSRRPLPDSRINSRQSFIFSMTLILSGLFYMILMVNAVAGAVALATTVIYLWGYTPLKRISALNVFVGAVPGALPVVGGWAAASGTVFEHGMWILFGIVFCWQIPHVMSIAWVCKKDYEHAGFKMLPKNDPFGYKTSTWILLPLLALLFSVYKVYVMDLAGLVYLSISVAVTLAYIYYGILFAIKRNHYSAKKLMFASFAYLPLIWIILFVDWAVF